MYIGIVSSKIQKVNNAQKKNKNLIVNEQFVNIK